MASISSLRSVSQRDATKLRKSKVRTTESLLEQAATRRGRAEVSDRTGIPSADLLRWAHQADMMRVEGVGSEYAELLVVVGVGSIRSLRRQNAETLMETMSQINTWRRIVQRLPTVEIVQSWITAAGSLEPRVKS